MSENLRNPCITMHQPWASLLVHGIKRIEGRSWPAPVRGRLWIHAASKAPEPETIKAMEEFYKEIYAIDGVTDINFPEHYPVSQLLGCVNVVGCVKCEELVCWEALPKGLRLEGQTDYCWLCEDPQKLVVPFGMRGYQRVYNLERKIFESAVRGLRPVNSPLPIKFPLPDPSNRFSLKPGSLATHLGSSLENLQKPPSLDAAIAGARAASSQYSRKEKSQQPYSSNSRFQSGKDEAKNMEQQGVTGSSQQKAFEYGKAISQQNNMHADSQIARVAPDQSGSRGSSSRIFSEALRSLRPK